MSEIETYFKKFIFQYDLSHVFVACSGGVDSMVLLHLASKFILETEVLHVNYQLRGNESNVDQLFVEEEAKKRGVQCTTKNTNLKEQLSREGGNLQEKARDIRYAFFKSKSKSKKTKILIAHHLDDQIETFFINLNRGGGMLGLAGMLPAKDNIFRPLLPFSKNEIVHYAAQNSIRWREDRSNEKLDYTRNKLRNKFLPEVYMNFPNLKEHVLLIMEKIQMSLLLIQDEVNTFLIDFDETSLLPFSIYDHWEPAHLEEFFRVHGIPFGLKIELVKLRKAEKGKKINLINPEFEAIFREENGFYFSRLRFNQIPAVTQECCQTLPAQFNLNTLYINPDKIKGELVVRPWKVGDRIKPIGMKGSKLISDILSDAKVPAHAKRNQLVVIDDEKIIWCVGFSASREAIATSQSKIIKLTIKMS